MKTVTHTCDIDKCGKIVRMIEGVNKEVIFTTDQTEGRTIKPYFHFASIDMCDDCFKRALSGEAIWAEGAQGHNRYWFKDTP